MLCHHRHPGLLKPQAVDVGLHLLPKASQVLLVRHEGLPLPQATLVITFFSCPGARFLWWLALELRPMCYHTFEH